MAASHSDALVLFGVTGDLAHKMIFPALYAMAKRGALKVPVIGVAFPKWSPERLHKRVTDSIRARRAGSTIKRALDHLLSLLRYVEWRLQDPDTFTALKKPWQRAAPGALSRHPAFALRNGDHRPRRGGLGRPCARHRREALRTRPRLGPGAESRRTISLHGKLHLSHRSLPRKGGDHEYPVFSLCQFVSGTDLESQLCSQRPDHAR